jgi:hypothetical protein
MADEMKAVDGFFALRFIVNMAWSIQNGLILRERTAIVIRLDKDSAFNERVCRLMEREALAALSKQRPPSSLQILLDKIEAMDAETPRKGGAQG